MTVEEIIERGKLKYATHEGVDEWTDEDWQTWATEQHQKQTAKAAKAAHGGATPSTGRSWERVLRKDEEEQKRLAAESFVFAMPYKKHEGKTLAEVMQIDPNYIDYGDMWRWAENIPSGFEPGFEPRLAHYSNVTHILSLIHI